MRDIVVKIALQSRLGYCRSGASLDLIELASELGATGVELADDRDVAMEELPPIRNRLAEAKIELASFHVRCPLSAEDDPTRNHDLDEARLGLERAALLGAGTFVFIPQSPPGGTSVEQARRMFRERVELLMPDVERLGLRPTFNNSGSRAAVFGQADYFRQLCEQFAPQAGMTFDVGNWLLAGEDCLVAAERLASWIIVVHLKDWTVAPGRGTVASTMRSGLLGLRHRVMNSVARQPARIVARMLGLRRLVPNWVRGMDGTLYSGAILGEGVIDLEAFLRLLHEIAYAGFLCVEYEGTGDLATAYRRGVERVRQILDDIARTASPKA